MLIHMTGGPDFDPNEAGPAYIYARLADHVAARIKAGELAPGARLPGERDLAAEYQVALGTVRRAIEELRSRGLVVTLPAKGTFVVSVPREHA
jgi:DNA-binding GntR family transcriptional regulator